MPRRIAKTTGEVAQTDRSTKPVLCHPPTLSAQIQLGLLEPNAPCHDTLADTFRPEPPTDERLVVRSLDQARGGHPTASKTAIGSR